ncbi:MAG: class I SAM-dependent methyltransferase [Anaerolineae bacterium]
MEIRDNPEVDMTANSDRLNEARAVWDAEAAVFDEQPDHGLHDPRVRTAWINLLKTVLPPAPATVLDIGCGTGSLSLVLAELSYAVTGIDYSPKMIAAAEAKVTAAQLAVTFEIMDAAFPQLPPQQFDVVMCRHVLWTLPEQQQVLQRWANLLKPGGKMLLVEGRWFTGAGLRASEVMAVLPPAITTVSVRDLSDQPDLWGGPISDERFALIATL